MLLVAFPVSRLLRNRPEEYNLRPDGDPPLPGEVTVSPKGATTQAAAGLTVAQALRTHAFWLISFGQGFGAMLASVIFTHLGLLMKDKGFDLQATAWVLAVHTAVTIMFQIVGGYVGDRIPKNVGLFSAPLYERVQGCCSPSPPACLISTCSLSCLALDLGQAILWS